LAQNVSSFKYLAEKKKEAGRHLTMKPG
jgi:hypothetical protein